jgi:hypothetical protein
MYIYKGKIIEPESDFGDSGTVAVTKSFCVSYLRCDGEVKISNGYNRNSGYYSKSYEASFIFKNIDEAVEFYKEVMKFIEGEESEFKTVDVTITPFSVYKRKEYRKGKFYLGITNNTPFIATTNNWISSDGTVYVVDTGGHSLYTTTSSITYEFDSLQELARNMDKCLEESKYL